MFRAVSLDAFTGAPIDELPVSSYTYDRLLSARGDGSATFPLDGTHTKAQLRDLLLHMARIIRLERDGAIEYMGYVNGRPYRSSRTEIGVELVDLWTLANRRGAWDHNAPNMERWSTTITGSRAEHAGLALLRGRTGPALPDMRIPVTIPGFPTGTQVTRPYYGYHQEKVADVWDKLMAEGLDIYLQPRILPNGDGDWLMRAGDGWGSGVQHEFFVNARESDVADFEESSDASRVTNNARNNGEGSEVDMLIRSERNTASPYPLLDRITDRRTITEASQLSAISAQDLVTYGQPTFQWDLTVPASHPIDVGDTAWMHFYGEPWIADGWHERRAVKVAGGTASNRKRVSLQPTGGA
ncbi:MULTISPECIES: hypothetical protein [unclassified Microbacterium]|uniref:hypothetical protein n=1 Tax=unclassified Microbacterium TaxID=2609290 RepID=UPI001604CD6A|nr:MULTISPECIES: hypothetical protein [unclassified Microbacterium]QNA93267.1 hypothetical protein G4G29_14780 [Microbacterium sp. Se63.02b]QYM63476.1 hypothetical protein K1X59_14830 [Microbacterium sp. Se5.02b]